MILHQRRILPFLLQFLFFLCFEIPSQSRISFLLFCFLHFLRPPFPPLMMKTVAMKMMMMMIKGVEEDEDGFDTTKLSNPTSSSFSSNLVRHLNVAPLS